MPMKSSRKRDIFSCITVKQMNRFIQKYFVLILALAISLGFIFDSFFLPLGNFTVPFLGALMLSSFLAMDYRIFLERLKKPGDFLIVFIIVKIFLPAGLYFLIQPLNPSLAIGILLVSAAPAAGISPSMTRLCRGDSEFVTGILIFTTLVSPITLPLTMNILAGTRMEIDMMGMITTMLTIIIFPMFLSLIIKKIFKDQVEKIKTYLGSAAIIILSLMLLGLTSRGASIIRENLGELPLYGISALILGAILSLGGYYLFFFMERKKRIGLSVSSLYVNIGLIIVLAASYFPERVIIFTLLYMLPANFFPGLIGRFVNRQGANSV